MATNFSPINSEFQSQYLIGMWQTVYIFKLFFFFNICVHLWNHHHRQDKKHMHYFQVFWCLFVFSPICQSSFPLPIFSAPRWPLPCLCCYRLVGFSTILHKRNPTEGSLSCLVAFTQNNYFEIHPCFHMSWSFPTVWIYHNLFIHQLMNIWAVPSSWLQKIKLLWTFVYRSLHECIYFLLQLYQSLLSIFWDFLVNYINVYTCYFLLLSWPLYYYEISLFIFDNDHL